MRPWCAVQPSRVQVRIDAIANLEARHTVTDRNHCARCITDRNQWFRNLVRFVNAIDEAELVRVGEACEAAPDWLPNRANVSFVEVRGRDLFVRTFERGVGLTDSCGSAMAASTYAACLTGRIAYDTQTTVFNKGGLVRAQANTAAMVTLSGNATFEWSGSVEVDPTTATASDVVVTRRYEDERAAWSKLVATL